MFLFAMMVYSFVYLFICIFEIWDSTDKQATYLLLGFETLNLKFRDLKLWKLTVRAGAQARTLGAGHAQRLAW